MTAKPKFKEQPTCENCGGQHHGSRAGYCPYIKANCVVCGDPTIYACSDCAIDSGGGKSVHVCVKSACQRTHEELHPDRKLQDLAPATVPNRDLIERASRIAIPSTGDDAADQKTIMDAAVHQARMDDNICPNGCGPMTWDDPHNRHCEICKFHGWCNEPFTGAKVV